MFLQELVETKNRAKKCVNRVLHFPRCQKNPKNCLEVSLNVSSDVTLTNVEKAWPAPQIIRNHPVVSPLQIVKPGLELRSLAWQPCRLYLLLQI